MNKEIHKDLRELIGEGKQGKVYSTDKKNIVIKVIPKNKFNNREYIYSKKIASLGLSPKIYKKITLKSHVMIYMQRIDYSMLDWIKKKRTKKEYKDSYRDVIKLIKKLHKNNIAHGDLHVGNIGRIKNKWVLIDFGFSHDLGTQLKVFFLRKKTKTIRGLPDKNSNKNYEDYFYNILQPYDKIPLILKFHLWRIS